MEGTTCRKTVQISPCPSFDTGFSCAAPTCADAQPFCHLTGPVGVRARQICSQTCGCDEPQSQLALSLPNNGCPERCTRTTAYREAMASLPCVDVPRDDENLQGYLNNWHNVAQEWPKDWKESSIIWVDLFRRFGCAYLTMDSPADLNYTMTANADNPTALFWPPNFAGPPPTARWGVNPCVANGNFYPIKPMSYFCPVACGCRAGDDSCPDTCPARMGPPNGLGQVAYTALEPNPSPRNVPNFAWRYSSTVPNSN